VRNEPRSRKEASCYDGPADALSHPGTGQKADRTARPRLGRSYPENKHFRFGPDHHGASSAAIASVVHYVLWLDCHAMVQERPVRVERRLAAILAADVAGYSRLMHHDEEATHARLTALLLDGVAPAISEHGGRIVKNTGDGFLAE
jgi:hypothetical protein